MDGRLLHELSSIPSLLLFVARSQDVAISQCAPAHAQLEAHRRHARCGGAGVSQRESREHTNGCHTVHVSPAARAVPVRGKPGVLSAARA